MLFALQKFRSWAPLGVVERQPHDWCLEFQSPMAMVEVGAANNSFRCEGLIGILGGL